ncbi:uncharacterized protein EAE97_011969 [Botrytis byssoidea]|uniref:Uncharacterized protein n=1 Tax=Botrytis byssoidea TaxID=139641 RepID=A0A9P5HN30_9HELO|nr:uncharacterized protein EAE97_011969 [Botrytis byssoidea]KAF7917831.1 hypothetical protein EAE97_011969 [Botrytis byssoidea]
MKPIKPSNISYSSSSTNFSSSTSDPSSNISIPPAIYTNNVLNNNNSIPPSLPSISTILQQPLLLLPITSTRTHNPITRLPTRNPASSAAVVSNTSTTTKGLVSTQRTKVIKTFISPKGSTKIILIITITTMQEPVLDKEKNSWVMRRTTEIRKVMVRKRLRPDSNDKKNVIVKRNTRNPRGKGKKGPKKGDFNSM